MDQTPHSTSGTEGNVSGGFEPPLTGTSTHCGPQTSFKRPRLILMDQTAHATSEIPVADTHCPIFIDQTTPLSSYPRPPFSGSILSGPLTINDQIPTHIKVTHFGGEDLSDAEKEERFAIFRSSFDLRAKELGIDYEPPENPSGKSYSLHRPLLAYDLKKVLKYDEEMFRRQYSYGTTAYGSTNPFTGMEVRHCLTSLFDDAFCWMEKSSGIMWVGVCGMNEICVVTPSGHVDWKRVHGGLASKDPETVLSLFRKCVLSELLDLAEPSSERCKKSHRSFATPFCVVSSTPGTTETPNKSGHETSMSGYAAEAILFVRSSGLLPKAQDSGAFVRLAISAFERLIQKKCEAKEIEVTVLSGRSYGVKTVRDLYMSEIEDYLATIDKTGLRAHLKVQQKSLSCL